MKQPKQHFTLTSLCVVLLATLSVVGGCSTESIDPGAGTDDGTPMPLTICATASSFDEALTVPADRLSFSVTRTPTQDGQHRHLQHRRCHRHLHRQRRSYHRRSEQYEVHLSSCHC